MEILLFIIKGLVLVPVFMLIMILICAYNDGDRKRFRQRARKYRKTVKKINDHIDTNVG